MSNMNVMYEGISYSRVKETGSGEGKKAGNGNKSQNAERSPGGEHLSRTQTLQIRFSPFLL